MKIVLSTFSVLALICMNANAACSSYSLQIDALGGDIASTAWTSNLRNMTKTKVETTGASEIIVCDNQVQVMDALIIGEPGTMYRSVITKDGAVIHSSDKNKIDSVGVGRFGASLLKQSIMLD